MKNDIIMKPLDVYRIKTREEVVQDIREAAQRMRTRGFAKFTRHATVYDAKGGRAEQIGSVCLLGAFESRDEVSDEYWAESRCPQALNVLAKFLPAVNEYSNYSVSSRIAEWNNATERKKAEVLQVLDTVAEKVEAGILSVV